MKTVFVAAIAAIVLVSFVAAQVASAASGPSALGSYRIVLADDLSKSLEFEAQNDERGATTGQMTFVDESRLVEQDVDGTGERQEESGAFSMTATLTSLTIEHNRALMSGIITDSSYRNYIGRSVQLVVEDNGDGRELPDQLQWRFCQQEPGGWVPADAEDPRDEGAYWHWWATDAERRDDEGIASINVIPGTTVGCQSFPLSRFSFAQGRGEGDIHVQP